MNMFLRKCGQLSVMDMQSSGLAALILVLLLGYIDVNMWKIGVTAESPSTPEPDPAPGCKAPQIRYTKPKSLDMTTEPTYAEFETTQLYLPDELTTPDSDSIEQMGIDPAASRTEAAVNPYQIDLESSSGANFDEEENIQELSTQNPSTRRRQRQNARRLYKKRRSGMRRRRLENENGQGGRGNRYRRHVIHKDNAPTPESDKWSGAKLAAEGDVYYVHLDELLTSPSLNKELRHKLVRMKEKHINERMSKCSKKHTGSMCRKKFHKDNGNTNNKTLAVGGRLLAPAAVAGDVVVDGNEPISREVSNGPYKRNHRMKSSDDVDAPTITRKGGYRDILSGPGHDENNNSIDTTNIANNDLSDARINNNNTPDWNQEPLSRTNEGNSTLHLVEGLRDKTIEEDKRMLSSSTTGDVATANNLQRVKRKSGKTTGALSRPKGGGDSGSKTTSRKDKGGFEEEGGYSPVHPDEEESEEDEEEETDADEQVNFTEVSEIRFPGEVGPLGDRRLCKIRCIKGKWVGPLCATNEEDEHGHIKFQPLYKSCHVNRIPPHLLLSYRNISVNIGWDLPHGHSLQARCKDLGLYKLLGESRVLCSNGLWAPRMPSCVPTTLLTNFSDDSAPSIRIKIGTGSGAFEPSGLLAVLPGSTIHLDCMYPRARGTPEWTWTSWYMQYNTGWSTLHEEKSTKYRLTIKDIQNSDSGTFTCTSPRGLTNSISIIVATSICPQLPEPSPPLSLRLEGNKLGQRALYRCPQGFSVEGTANSTCLASGNWSTPPPTCHAVQCPRLILEDSHLSLVELNTSAWGRAVFKCQWGFKLSGPPGLECEPSGVWSGPVPRCRAIQCPAPLVPLNGRIGGTSGSSSHRRYSVGALVTFSCNEGHLLVGEASIVCTETGFWSHPPPFCKSQCPYPGDPPNGLIAPLKFNYDSGDFLSVQCRPGFVEYSPSGPPERPKCLPDGNWSGPVPQCRSYEEV